MTVDDDLLAVQAGIGIGLAFFIWLIFRAYRRHGTLGALVAIIPGAPLGFLLIYVFHPFGPVDRLRVLDVMRLENGTELRLTQSLNKNWGEPYTVRFWARPEGKDWLLFYMDHQDHWWPSGLRRKRSKSTEDANWMQNSTPHK